MDLTPNDKKVVDLLSKLKNSNGAYPSDIFAARRQTYLKQVANIGLGIGVSAGLKNAAKSSSNSTGAIATVTSKILEAALIAAIAIEAGAAAYLYRDKIADLIRTYTSSSNVQVVAPPADDTATSVPELLEIIESPSATALTPSGTPSPELAIGSTNDNGGNNASSSVDATPNPGGNDGNQYGLTPKPIRTKDNNSGNNINDSGSNTGGGNGGNNGNNNKP